MTTPIADQQEKYPLPMRILHWAMFIVFVCLFVLGPIMVDLDKNNPLRAELFGLHKSLGVTIIILLAIRLAIRLRSAPPELPASLPRWEVGSAHWGHRLLYFFMGLVPLTGWAVSDLHGKAVKLFGLPMPKIFPTLENIGGGPGELHGFLAYTLLAIIALHVAAVAKHRFLDHADLLHRMF